MDLLIHVVGGALGGNVAGSLLKNISLGLLGNSLVGILGAAAGSQALSALGLGAGPEATGTAITSLGSGLASAGIGGGLLMIVVGVVKSLAQEG